MANKSGTPCIILCVLLSAVAGFSGYLLPPFILQKLHKGILDNVIWRPDSPPEAYERFLRDDHPGDPLDFCRFYFWNITNLQEVQNGATPELEEVGPYTYIKHRRKVDALFSGDGTVQFKAYEYLLHLPGNSAGNASADIITTANIPLLGALAKARTRNLESTLAAALKVAGRDSHNDGIFLRRTPQELLFGYQEPLFSIIHRFVPSFSATFSLVPNVTSEDEAHGLPLNVVDTGLRNLSRLWQQVVWNGISEVTSWNNHTEGVRGSDAFQFSPGLGLNSTIVTWVGQLFRAATLVATKWVSLHGVALLRFKPDPHQFDVDPRFFQFVRGLPNISEPTNSGPSGNAGDAAGPMLYMSFPHYCLADEALQQNVSGLNCDLHKHGIFVDVEPITGATMRAAKRLQLVVQYGENGKQTLQPKVTPTFLPVFWVEEYNEAGLEQAHMFASQVYWALDLAEGICTAGVVLSIAFALAALLGVVMACFARGVHRKRRHGSHSRHCSSSAAYADAHAVPQAEDQPSASAAGAAVAAAVTALNGSSLTEPLLAAEGSCSGGPGGSGPPEEQAGKSAAEP